MQASMAIVKQDKEDSLVIHNGNIPIHACKIRQMSGRPYLQLFCDRVVDGKLDEMYTRC